MTSIIMGLITEIAIEIMGHSKTDPELVDLMLKESGEHGFSPFHVKQDSMGYIYNRYIVEFSN